MAKRKGGNGNGDSDPIILAESDEPTNEAAYAPAPLPAPAAVPVGLSFVRLSPGRVFQGLVTISLADLAHITIGGSSGGPNGYGVLAYQGRMFSQLGEFTGDDNPAHDPFIGMPIYAEV